MMRYFFLTMLLFTLAASPVGAQRLPASTPLDSSPPAPPAPDTVAALHRLFAAKRHQSAGVISATVATGLLALLVAENTRHSYTIDATPVIATGISLLSIPAIITEIGYYRQFTRRKETRVVGAFAEKKLPAKMKRQLRPAYFQAEAPK